jgi:hypothetical protein
VQDNPNGEAQPQTQNDTVILEDPDNAVSKGRPRVLLRQKGIAEDMRSRPKPNFTCTHCREGGHNIKTCKKKHLPAVPANKKKRKNTHNGKQTRHI